METKKVVLAEIEINVDGVLDRQRELLAQQEQLKKQQAELNALKKVGVQLTEEQENSYIQNQATLKNLSDEYRQNTKILSVRQQVEKDGINTIDDARKAVAAVSIEWARVTKIEGENSENSKRLGAEKLALTERLKELEAATGDNTRSVGGYAKGILEAMETLKKQQQMYEQQIVILNNVAKSEKSTAEEKERAVKLLDETKVELSKTNTELAKYENYTANSSNALEEFGGKLGINSNVLKTFSGGTKSVGTALTGLGNTMKALIVNPFFLVIAAVAGIFMMIKEAIGKNAEIMDKLAVALKPVQLLFGAIMNVVGKLIEVLVGKFADAMSFVADLFDGAGDSTKKYMDAVKNLQDLEDKMLNQKLKDKQLQEEINNLDAIAADRTKSKEERLKALTDSIAKQKQIAKENADLQTEQLNNYVTDLQGTYGIKEKLVTKDFQLSQEALNKLNETDKAALETQISNYLDAKNKKSEIDKETMKKKSTLELGMSQEEEAENQKRIENRKKANEKYIKLLEYQSNYFKATNETLLKEGVRIDAQLIEKEEKRLKKIQELDTISNEKAFKLGLRSKEEYTLQKIAIDKAYNDSIIELGNAAIEQQRTDLNLQIQEWEIHNRRKIENAKELTYDLIIEETLRLDQQKQFRLQEIALSNETEDQKRINRLQVEAETSDQIAQMQLDYDNKRKAQEQEALANEMSAAFEYRQLTATSEREAEMNDLNKWYSDKLALALKNEEDTTNLTLIYEKKKTDIKKKEQANQLALIAQAFGNMAELFGKGTKAGKAAASAQTAITSLQASFAAFKSGVASGLPPPFNFILGGTLAATTAALGAKAIRDIWAVDEKGGTTPSSSPVAAPIIPQPTTQNNVPTNFDGGFANNNVGTGNTGQNQGTTIQPVLVVDQVTAKQMEINRTQMVATL